jgi:nucleoside-diphosphate-sugar epimerase
MTDPKKKNTLLYNSIFVVVGGALLFFLLNAPEESTRRIPYDDNHQRFYSMGKKEAEKFCESCHHQQGEVPLPIAHPPKYRCLFCHKKVEKNGR